jgi:hypothetical protein
MPGWQKDEANDFVDWRLSGQSAWVRPGTRLWRGTNETGRIPCFDGELFISLKPVCEGRLLSSFCQLSMILRLYR